MIFRSELNFFNHPFISLKIAKINVSMFHLLKINLYDTLNTDFYETFTETFLKHYETFSQFPVTFMFHKCFISSFYKFLFFIIEMKVKNSLKHDETFKCFIKNLLKCPLNFDFYTNLRYETFLERVPLFYQFLDKRQSFY